MPLPPTEELIEMYSSLVSSAIVGGIGFKFFISTNKTNSKAYKHLQKATYRWYDNMNNVNNVN